MSETVIQVSNLSKRYRIGMKEKRADTITGRMMNILRSPLDNFRQLRSLSKFREDDESVFWALRDINFKVQEGEVLGIIGHNGAGKSTLLKILSRITEPTSGSVKLKGRVSALLEVGTGFHPELTGRENIYMNGTILGMTRREIDHNFDEIVDFSGVEKYIDTPVKFYSSGMKVRLGFAVAAHLEPEILIIDEVLAVGDAEFQKKCLGKMESVAGEGRTVLFVSHNMAAVKTLCKSGLILKNGEIVYYGNSADSVEYYLATYRSTSVLELANRKDRQGTGKLKFQSISFENKAGEKISDVISGEFLRIKIGYRQFERIQAEDLILAISIQTNLGEFVCSFISDEMGDRFDSLNETDDIILDIPNLYLRGGSYFLRLLACEKDTQPENFLDLVENATSLHVIQGDVWKSGKTNRSGEFAIFPAHFSSLEVS